MLGKGKRMNVGEIAEKLKISFNATSNHLAILKNLDVLDGEGTDGHVVYSLNSRMPDDFYKAVSLL